MLADAALHILLLKVIHDTYLSKNEMDQLKDLYNSMLQNSFVPAEDEALMPECVQKLHDSLMDCKAKLGEQSRTAVLWLKYLDYVQILKDFIRADRTSHGRRTHRSWGGHIPPTFLHRGGQGGT